MGFSTTVLLITDDWVQRKLGEVAPLQRGFDLPKSEMCAGEYPVVMSNGINGFHSEFKAKAPGVVTGRSGTIGNLFFIEKDYWPHNTALWVTDFMGNHPKFIYHLYRKVDLNRFGTGTGVPTLNRNDVHAEFVFIPNIKEQIKISEFYTTFDKINGLYKRKTENLKLLKKACLQQMFPNDGETVPKIRFTGFTGDWEEAKLGDVADFKNGMNFSKEAMGHGFPFVNLQNIFGQTIVDTSSMGLAESNEQQRKEYCLKKGDVLFIRSSVKPEGVGEAAIIPYDLVDTTYSGFIIRCRMTGNFNDGFKQFMFGTEYFRSQMLNNATTSANTNINQDSLSKMTIKFPITEEQNAIGEFFRNIDGQITVQQTKLDNLKRLKSAYLQKMFV